MMIITITVYGFVKVTGGQEIKTETYYFATEEERDEMALFIIANEDCKIYGFEYDKEVEV